MREFKSGTLKSGGSGKKVTNPKQAIAIALSEANAMNQGGMMQNPVMQRPMFQTPMQRESMGIMAGVAPIRGYREGGSAAPEYTPKFLRDDQDEDSLGSELFRLLVVDVNDPIDVAISSAAAGMAATGIGGPAAALAKLAGTGRKLFRGADAAAKAAAKAEEKVKKMEQAGLFKKAAGEVGAKTGRFAAEKEVMSIGSDAVDQITPPIRMTMAEGGIASLPVVYAADGGFLDIISKIPGVGKKLAGIAALISKSRGKGPKSTKKPDSSKKKESKKKEDKEQPEEEVIIEGGGSRIPGLDYIKDNKLASTLAAIIGGGALYNVVPPLAGKLLDDDEDEKEPLPPSPPPPGPPSPNPPPSVQSLPAGGGVMQLDASGNPQGLVPGVGVNPGGDDTEERGGIRDFLTNTISKLQDPRLQYQLAKAAQPSEGFTPRNFFSDVTLAGQEYDDMKAKRDYLEAQTRSEQKTDLEKLTDFYMTTIDTEGLTSDQASEIRRQFATSLFKDQQRAGEMETLVEILSLIPNSDITVEIFKKFEGGESSFDKAMADALEAIQRAKGP